ncbi:carboxypeptidase regulatory-like domain-containing protein [Novosphingobium huizhouense]|uniref:carboxypeptidase regulatory-like domain-containing protein n=1 Tax=Novosphingobium huizhouense TaxID=2866625 RepID=UPI001CD8B906|nr:carboxypeptidase regulatory-like domain-containing protein [Novosphingobium huizhouense]
MPATSKHRVPTLALRIAGLGLVPLTLSAAPPAVLPLQVVDAAGLPVRDAVIEIAPPPGDTRRPAFRWRNAMAQRDQAFVPGTLIVPRGAVVAFPNLDTVRHSIYSFSKPGPFKIDLYGHDQTRTQQFKVAGSIALGCNIHDQMRGYIRVTDTPYAALTDLNGLARIEGLAPGTYSVVVWHPAIRGANNEWRGRLQLDADKRARIALALRATGAR